VVKNKMSIGNNMRSIRKEKGMTLQQIADIMGCSPQLISQYESGKRQPKLETQKKIAAALGCEVSDIDGNSRVNLDKRRPYDIAIQKYQNNEELTEEEEQAIIEYVESGQLEKETEKIKQIAQKAYNYVVYMHSNSYASSEEEFNKLQKEHQIKIGKKWNSNIYKYDASIHTEITPEQIEINRILNKILNDTENVTKEEAKFYNDYYTSEQYKNSFKHLMETAQENLKIIKRLQTAYETLNEDGQEKVAEHAEMIAKIPEYQKKPDEPPQE